jgi:hypothetical protein
LQKPAECQKFLELIQSNSKPPNFFATHVRQLLIGPIWGSSADVDIISACTNLSTLAIWKDTSLRTIILNPEFKRLKRFSCTIESLQRFKPSRDQYTFFSSLTHLDIACDDLNWGQTDLLDTLNLQSLTHLSLDCSSGESNPADFISYFSTFLSSIPVPISANFKLLIYFKPMSVEYDSDWVLKECDERVVLAIMDDPDEGFVGIEESLNPYIMQRPFSTMIEDWGYCPPDKPDMWEIAEEIRDRRAKFRRRQLETEI